MNSLAQNDPSGKSSAVVAFGDYVSAGSSASVPAEHPAVAFLKAFDPDGWHNLVRFDPSGRRSEPIGLTIPPGRWDLAEAFVREADGRENCYFSVNEPRAGSPNKKLTKEDVGAIRAITADIDLPGPNTGDEVARLQGEVGRAFEGIPEPSFLVDSGGGVQAHWRLVNKLPVVDAMQWAEDQARAIARHVGGDNVGNIDRIMRLPGTINLPDAGKRAKGRLERPASILREAGPCSPDELRTALSPIPISTAGRLDANERIAALQVELSADMATIGGAASLADLTDELQARFRKALQQSLRLARLWEGEPPASGDTTGSAYRAALALHLGQSGGFTAYDFAALAWVWDHAVQPHHDRDEKLTARALARDWINIGEPASIETFFEKPSETAVDGQSGSPFSFATATRIDPGTLDGVPDRVFVLGSRFQAGTLTLGAGPPGVSKSTFAMMSALAIATGKSLTGETVTRTGRVLIYNAEDPRDEMMRRLLAMARLNGLDMTVVLDRVRILSGYDDRRLVFAERRERSGPVRPGGELDAFVDYIVADEIVHAVLDPLVSLHRGLDENSSADMEALGDQLRRSAQRSGASIDLIHHTIKNRTGQPEGNAGVADAARGSGAVVGFVRSAYTLVPMAPKFGSEIGLDADRISQMVRLDDAKRNYSRRSARERWFEVKSVLPTGQIVSASDFEAVDTATRRRAYSSAGVHVPFDVNRQRALSSIAKADSGEIQDEAQRRFIVSLIEGDEAERVSVTARFGAALGMKETTARKRVDDLVTAGRKDAAEIEVDGSIYALWRELRSVDGVKKWVLLRALIGQVVHPDSSNEVQNEELGGVFG